ncbi:LysR family transcriptional regulator [Rhizobiales bacterium]|uniref:LysR family transcriptional regulator n=1 Tax=Hongsoonwoonella zoysiae TaxID=2821844 RepID=UPI00156074CC|nr:LysR family transcriptional regulator [Hongsoonwoonella zoysiae]NRG16630.1 LysR family transcriptional regulator [Hongsoonwoonella zoysiae]
MEIRALKTFLAVAELGTVSQASRRLNCVQSNVTSRIKALEEELGIELFSRGRNGMTLTPAGTYFLDHAKAVVDAESAAIASLANFAGAVRLLRIGSMESTLAIRLPAFLARFRAANPDVRLGLRSGPTDELVGLLLENRIDIALIGGQFRHPDLKSRIVFSEEMVLATDTGIQSPEQVGAMPLIVFKPGCSYRAYAQNWMRRSGFAPNDIIELGTLEGILGCVASGVGVTLLPRSVVESSGHRNIVNLHQLGDQDRFIDTLAVRSAAAPENGAVDAFLDLLCGARHAAPGIGDSVGRLLPA